MPKRTALLPYLLFASSVFLVGNIGAQAQSELPQSKSCSADAGGWSPPGGVPTTGQITMSNDGGWCGERLAVLNNTLVFGGAMHLSKQPAHGKVSIMPRNDGTDVYYMPEPGYIGPDSFGVLVEIFNIDKPYNVTVK
jgi:hypothetical protein